MEQPIYEARDREDPTNDATDPSGELQETRLLLVVFHHDGVEIVVKIYAWRGLGFQGLATGTRQPNESYNAGGPRGLPTADLISRIARLDCTGSNKWVLSGAVCIRSGSLSGGIGTGPRLSGGAEIRERQRGG